MLIVKKSLKMVIAMLIILSFISMPCFAAITELKLTATTGSVNGDIRSLAIYETSGGEIYAFVWSGDGILLYNVTNSASPLLCPQNANFKFDSDVWDINGVLVSGDYLYFMCRYDKNISEFTLVKIDIRDPLNPGTPVKVSLGGGRPYNLAVNGNYLYRMSQDTLWIHDISGDGIVATPIMTCTFTVAFSTAVLRTAIDDNVLCAMSQTEFGAIMLDPVTGMPVMNAQDKCELNLFNSKTSPMGQLNFRFIALTRGRLYVSSNTASNCMIIVNPYVADEFESNYSVYNSASTEAGFQSLLYDNYNIYASYAGRRMIDVINCDDPDNPVINGAGAFGYTSGTADNLNGIRYGNHLYFAARDQGIQIFTISIYDVSIETPADKEFSLFPVSLSGLGSGTGEVTITVRNSAGAVSLTQNASISQATNRWTCDISYLPDGSYTYSVELSGVSDALKASTIKTSSFKAIPQIEYTPIIFSTAAVTPEALTAGITASASLSNNVDGSQEIMLVMFLYKDGLLEAVSYDKKTLAKGDISIPASATLTKSGLIGSGYTIKAFIVDNDSNYRPLSTGFILQ